MAFSKIIQSGIQFWLNTTGRKLDYAKMPHLKGPLAGHEVIGDQFYQKLAKAEDLGIVFSEDGGLLPDFSEVVDQANPLKDVLIPEISKFYEATAQYNMEVWSKWIPPISWFAKIIIRSVSTKMQQLNIPLSPLETSYGMSSNVIHLVNKNGEVKYVCWLRKSVKSNKVVYAGFYSVFQLDDSETKHVKVVFPLTSGNITVILKVDLLEDGSVKLISNKRKFPGTGYYRLHQNKKGTIKYRRIPIKEIIHVFKDENEVLRTDHFFSWARLKFLHLHYKMNKKKG
ncbi:MAG: hypothetical protein ACI8ZM_005489 [Crocinitomix sp.]|jgi:hypothetical protein